MSKRSNLPLALGVVAFLVGAAIVVLVLRNGADGQPSATGRTSTSALVATKAIAPGTTGRQLIADGILVSKPVDGASRPSDAVVSAAELDGRVVSAQVQPGQPLTKAMLRPETLRAGSFKIPEGKQAVAVQLPFVPGGAGYVGAGDRVNVYGAVKNAPGGPVVRMILSGVEVLDTSTEVAPRRATTGAQPGERPAGEQVTYLLALSPEEAGEVIYLSAYESVWMALMPEGQQPSGLLTVGVNEVMK